MSRRLSDKVAIVTGASSGLGRAIARAYSREGALVVCSDLRPTARSEVSQETETTTHELIEREGGKAIFVQTDVTDSAQVQNLVAKAVEAFGRLDVMVNNAGISAEARTPGPVHQTDEALWHGTMAANVDSVFYGCKYATRQMLQQDPHPSGDRGWIVNLASVLGLVALNGCPAYSTSKGAVCNLTRQVALDYAPHRIHCNAICPGFTKTAMFVDTTAQMENPGILDMMHPFKGPGMPEDIAKIAVVLASDDASWMTGANVPVDGGYTAR